uniref:Uncharacterized protein n=1 Tax=Tanacetum cinerariifolium TaxID=118510 RepID=A0A699TE44_TANCI|nr:hypothetical protein [Tanacetum cinerariifolium]
MMSHLVHPTLPTIMEAQSFFEDESLEDDSIGDSSGTDESLPAQTAPAIAHEPPSVLSPLIIAAYPSSPPPSLAHLGPSRMRPRSLPSSSTVPTLKRCKVSPTLVLPALALHSMSIELLPPRKRFTVLKRIETLEREVESLTVRLAVVEI